MGGPTQYSGADMKVPQLFSWIVLSLAPFAAAMSNPADSTAIDATIRQAAEYLRDPSSDGNAEKGFRLLVDAVGMTAPQTGYAVEFGKQVGEARERFKLQGSFDEKGITLLQRSYSLANSGREFRMPAGISTIKGAAERIRLEMDAARQSLKKGDSGDCARRLLVAALMIVTPMER